MRHSKAAIRRLGSTGPRVVATASESAPAIPKRHTGTSATAPHTCSESRLGPPGFQSNSTPSVVCLLRQLRQPAPAALFMIHAFRRVRLPPHCCPRVVLRRPQASPGRGVIQSAVVWGRVRGRPAAFGEDVGPSGRQAVRTSCRQAARSKQKAAAGGNRASTHGELDGPRTAGRQSDREDVSHDGHFGSSCGGRDSMNPRSDSGAGLRATPPQPTCSVPLISS